MGEIGFEGMGKLGTPVAYTFADAGHDVMGYDVNPLIAGYLENQYWPFQEEHLEELMRANRVRLGRSVGELVAESETIFVPIQTPHEAQYEGATRLPETRKDFDYSFLREGIASLAAACEAQKKHRDVVIISTVLPGTIEREIKPLLNEYTHLAYQPMFIAMGTVIDDVRNPEFVLVGVDEPDVADRLEEFWKTIHDKPVFRTDVKTAEGIKVFYNTIITAKTVLANAMGEMAHKTGMNVDDIFRALSMATDRIISPKYLQAGVGDGGGCHPRDNIALSAKAEEIGMSHNVWEDLMVAREDHMGWLAQEAVQVAEERRLPIIILGRAFKPNTNIETGSAARLMASIVEEKGYAAANVEDVQLTQPAVVVIGTKHEHYRGYRFPAGSVVIDPFRFIEDQEGVEVIRIGDGDESRILPS